MSVDSFLKFGTETGVEWALIILASCFLIFALGLIGYETVRFVRSVFFKKAMGQKPEV